MALGLIEQLGIAGILLFPLYFLGKWAINKIIKESNEKQENLTQKIDDLYSTMLVNGKLLRIEEVFKRQDVLYKTVEKVLDEDRSLCRDIIDTNKRISSEEQWKNCPIDRCPHLSGIRDSIWRLEAELLDFVKEMDKGKRETTERILSIDQSMKGFANEFISTHKTILDGLLKGRNYARDRDQGNSDNEAK